MVTKGECHNDGAMLVHGTAELRREVDGRVSTATIPAMVCPKCGVRIYEYRDAHSFNVASRWLDEALATYDEPHVWADIDDEPFVEE